MKLILSRKGLDSSFGPFPSPILPSGTLAPIPIPDSSEKKRLYRYDDLSCAGYPMGDIVESLSSGALGRTTPVHLDPDLELGVAPRSCEWVPAFGQRGSALSHLEKNGVGIKDLFLFFGWFRETEMKGGELRYLPNSPDLHVLFGWLQVGDVIRDPWGHVGDWVASHPHGNREEYGRRNTIYASAGELDLGSGPLGVPGSGLFRDIASPLVLTERGKSRSHWLLPEGFYPNGRTSLTYHADPRRWEMTEAGARLAVVGRGQEFVLDCDEYPEVVEWIVSDLLPLMKMS